MVRGCGALKMPKIKSGIKCDCHTPIAAHRDFRVLVRIDRPNDQALSPTINFSGDFLAHLFLTRYRAPVALQITRRREGDKKKSAATKEGTRGETRRGRELATHAALEISKKSISLFRAFRVSRLRQRCIAHYLMDGFSLCSADSLTAGPPDCTLRPFSGCTGEPWFVVLEGGTQGEKGARGGVAGGMKWSGREWCARGGTCSRVVA